MQRTPGLWRFCLAAIAVAALLPAAAHAVPFIEFGTYNFTDPVNQTGGTLDVQTNTGAITIPIYVHGGDTGIVGVNMSVEIGQRGALKFDGGIYSGGTAAGTAPPFTSRNIPGDDGMNSKLALNLTPASDSLFNSTNASVHGMLPTYQGPMNAAPDYGGADDHFVGKPQGPNWVSQLWDCNLSTGGATVSLGGTTPSTHVLVATITLDTTGWTAGEQFAIAFVNTDGGDTSFINNSGQVDVVAPDGIINIIPEPATASLLFCGAPLLLLRKRKMA